MGPGSIVTVPPMVIHGFGNTSEADVWYANLHSRASGSTTTCAGCGMALGPFRPVRPARGRCGRAGRRPTSWSPRGRRRSATAGHRRSRRRRHPRGRRRRTGDQPQAGLSSAHRRTQMDVGQNPAPDGVYWAMITPVVVVSERVRASRAAGCFDEQLGARAEHDRVDLQRVVLDEPRRVQRVDQLAAAQILRPRSPLALDAATVSTASPTSTSVFGRPRDRSLGRAGRRRTSSRWRARR